MYAPEFVIRTENEESRAVLIQSCRYENQFLFLPSSSWVRQLPMSILFPATENGVFTRAVFERSMKDINDHGADNLSKVIRHDHDDNGDVRVGMWMPVKYQSRVLHNILGPSSLLPEVRRPEMSMWQCLIGLPDNYDDAFFICNLGATLASRRHRFDYPGWRLADASLIIFCLFHGRSSALAVA